MHTYISTFVTFLTLLAWFTLKQGRDVCFHVTQDLSQTTCNPSLQRIRLKAKVFHQQKTN